MFIKLRYPILCLSVTVVFESFFIPWPSLKINTTRKKRKKKFHQNTSVAVGLQSSIGDEERNSDRADSSSARRHAFMLFRNYRQVASFFGIMALLSCMKTIPRGVTTVSTMMRFQLIAPNFDGTPATFSESKCRKMTEESVCQHLAAVQIRDVKRNLGFDDESHPTIQGSENGSTTNMLLCTRLPKCMFQEDCSGR